MAQMAFRLALAAALSIVARFVFYEIFASEADFEAHNATPHVRAWFAKLPALADGGVKVTRMAILGD